MGEGQNLFCGGGGDGNGGGGGSGGGDGDDEGFIQNHRIKLKPLIILKKFMQSKINSMA